jgi:WD40 repeat protein
MEFVGGVNLEDRARAVGPLAVREVVRIGAQAARGLAAAHAQGLVHRDVKPANILLENGIERVRITDFGLARAVDDASLTRSGVLAGTPLYMSPEQARGERVDHRTDLFSLGSVLYTLCTGHPAFRADGTAAVIRRVSDDTPRPVREVNPDVPVWLARIVSRLMAKSPTDRFQTAAEVAGLLERCLAHLEQPDVVPLPGECLPGRACRRVGWGLIGGSVALGVVLAAGLATLPGQKEAGSAPESAAPKRAKQAPEPVADRPPAIPLGERKRSEIPEYLLAAVGLGDPAAAPPELIAALGRGRVYDSASGRELIPAPDLRARCVSFSPDGQTLAVGDAAGTVWLWDLSAWAADQPAPPARVLTGDGREIRFIAFSPDGKHLAATCSATGVALWDVAAGVRRGERLPASANCMIAFSPAGSTLAVPQMDGSIDWYDVATGARRASLPIHDESARPVAFSPDGRWMASSGVGNAVVITNIGDRSARIVANSTSSCSHLAFTPDGNKLLGTRTLPDGRLQMWDTSGGNVLELETESLDEARGLAVHPGSRVAATCDRAGVIRVWDLEGGGRRMWSTQVPAIGAVRQALAYSPDGRHPRPVATHSRSPPAGGPAGRGRRAVPGRPPARPGAGRPCRTRRRTREGGRSNGPGECSGR